jgi:hypothetical protein
MVVRGLHKDDSESGQSVLEFLLMLPMLVGLVVILIKVNTAIQISIVNQQYARAHTLWLAFNSPVYPQLKLREPQLTAKQYNQMVLGVSTNPPPSEGEFSPEAATHYIARKKGVPDKADKDTDQRALVRVRDTVTLCTQPNVVKSQGGSYVPILDLASPDKGRSWFPRSSFSNTLPEQGRVPFEYCRAPMQYVNNSDGDT